MTNDEYLQRILELIDEQPVCKSAIRKALCIGEQRCNTLLDRLVATNRAVPKAVGPHRYWHTPRLWTAMYARETMADLQAHRDMLVAALREAIGIIEELCAAHKHPEPEASMTRMQKALDFDA